MTGYEILALLPEHIQEQYKNNILRERGSLSNLKEPCDKNNLISSAFIWSKTPQGQEYWQDIQNMLREGNLSPEAFEELYRRYPEHSKGLKRDQTINNYQIY